MEAHKPLKRGLPPTHPGEVLRDVVLPALKAEGVGKGELAQRLGISRGMLDKLTGEVSAVTPEMALRLERVVGSSAQMWLNMQAAWDLAKARAALGDQLKALRPVPMPPIAA